MALPSSALATTVAAWQRVEPFLAKHKVSTIVSAQASLPFALAVAAVIATPLGLYIGHTGRGSVVVAGLANSLRALPTIGLLILLVLIIAPSFPNKLAYLIPSLIVLVLLAIPPILTNTYAGVRAVDQAAVDVIGAWIDGSRNSGSRRIASTRSGCDSPNAESMPSR